MPGRVDDRASAGDARHRQAVPGRPGAGRRRPRRPRGRGPLPARAERRRQVDAHQGPRRRAPARRRRRHLARQAGDPGRAAGRHLPGDRDDLPGTRPGAQSHRRGQHLPRPGAVPIRPRPAGGGQPRGHGAAHPAGASGDPPRRRGGLAVGGGAADGQHRARPLAGRPADRHGRALGRPGQRGGPAPVRRHPRPHLPRCRRRLHLPPAGGDPRDRRPDHRAQGRRDGRHRAGRPHHADPRRHHPHDRPDDRVRLPRPLGHAAPRGGGAPGGRGARPGRPLLRRLLLRPGRGDRRAGRAGRFRALGDPRDRLRRPPGHGRNGPGGRQEVAPRRRRCRGRGRGGTGTRGAQEPGAAAGRVDREQHQRLQPDPLLPRRVSLPRRGEDRGRGTGGVPRRPAGRCVAGGAHALRWQPAEDRAGPLAAARLPRAPAGRAHPRCRRRRPLGDLRAHPLPRRPRGRGRRRVQRDPRGARSGRPGPRGRRRSGPGRGTGRRTRRAPRARHGHGTSGLADRGRQRCSRARGRRGMSGSTTTATSDLGNSSPAGGTKPSGSSRRAGLLAGPVGRNLGLFIALALLCVAGVVTAGSRFADIENVLTILRLASVIGVVSIGMTFVIIGGGIDLSVGAIVALSSVWATTLATQNIANNFHWIAMVFTAIVVGGVTGLVNGVVIAYGKLVAFIATLAMLAAARGFAEILSNRKTQIIRDSDFLRFFSGSILGVPTLVIMFALVAVAGWILLNRTTFGRRTFAVGGNAEAARLAGIRVQRHTVLLYVLSGVACGIAAVMLMARTTTGSATHGILYELDAIAAVVIGGTLLIGGRGTIVGTVLGVVIFTTLGNVFTLNNLSSSAQAVARGVIIVFAVLLQMRLADREGRVRRARAPGGPGGLASGGTATASATPTP